MGNFLLFILLGYIFYRVYRGYKRFQQTYYTQRQFQNFTLTKEHLERSELGLFVALIAKVAKADGRVDELEAELIGNMFNDISRLFPDPEKTRQLLKEIFNAQKQERYNLDELAIALYAQLRNEPVKRRNMMAFWISLAYADGKLTHAEENILRKLAAFMHIDAAQFNSLMEQIASMHANAHKESSVDDAYKTLGVKADDTMESVKKAYRALVKKHHPDIIKAQGASDEYIQQANEKVQTLNAAYEMIKKAKG